MIGKLVENIKKTNAPIVVGLDPMLSFVPDHIKKEVFSEYGETLEAAAEIIYRFNVGIVEACADLIPAVKPQIAMYEQFGIPGLAAFKKTVDLCKEKGLCVIGDVKRGDIGSTSAAYAAAHLGTVEVCSWMHADILRSERSSARRIRRWESVSARSCRRAISWFRVTVPRAVREKTSYISLIKTDSARS